MHLNVLSGESAAWRTWLQKSTYCETETTAEIQWENCFPRSAQTVSNSWWKVLLLWESAMQTEHHIWQKNYFCLIKGWRLCEAGAVSLGRSTMVFGFLIKNGISLTLSVTQVLRIFSVLGLKSSWGAEACSSGWGKERELALRGGRIWWTCDCCTSTEIEDLWLNTLRFARQWIYRIRPNNFIWHAGIIKLWVLLVTFFPFFILVVFWVFLSWKLESTQN